jgi:hypothetical protein
MIEAVLIDQKEKKKKEEKEKRTIRKETRTSLVLANPLTCIPCQDGNGEFPIGFRSAIPVPAKSIGGHLIPIPVPRGELTGN